MQIARQDRNINYFNQARSFKGEYDMIENDNKQFIRSWAKEG